MTTYTVIDPPAQITKIGGSAASNIIAAIAEPLAAVDNEEQFFALFSRGYNWYSDSNKWEAQNYLQGALVAYQHHFDQQVMLYKDQLISIATKDMAARTRSIVKQLVSCHDFTYYHPDNQPMPDTSFTAPYQTNESGAQRYQWVYGRLETFPRLIPPNALQILARLEKDNMMPQAYWVADKVEIAQRRSLDPILCTQFGRWFVGIAKWN